MNELTTYQAGAVARPIDIEALFRAAIERGPEGVAVMERLVAVRRELNAEAAKRAFDDALAGFQDECPPVEKTKGVPTKAGSLAYRYAPFEQILDAVKPTMRKFGFSFTLDTDTASEAGWVIAKCKVTHAAGHSEVSSAKFPLGDGTQIMSKTQVYAAALTFASRRVFCNAFGIVTKGEDTDGQWDLKPKTRKPGEKPIPPQEPTPPQAPVPAQDAQRAQVARLWHLLKPIRGAAQNWTVANGWLRSKKLIQMDEIAQDLSAEKLDRICALAEVAMKEGA